VAKQMGGFLSTPERQQFETIDEFEQYLKNEFKSNIYIFSIVNVKYVYFQANQSDMKKGTTIMLKVLYSLFKTKGTSYVSPDIILAIVAEKGEPRMAF
jgi:hypothetical protein